MIFMKRGESDKCSGSNSIEYFGRNTYFQHNVVIRSTMHKIPLGRFFRHTVLRDNEGNKTAWILRTFKLHEFSSAVADKLCQGLATVSSIGIWETPVFSSRRVQSGTSVWSVWSELAKHTLYEVRWPSHKSSQSYSYKWSRQWAGIDWALLVCSGQTITWGYCVQTQMYCVHD